jgi:hypothetical protein
VSLYDSRESLSHNEDEAISEEVLVAEMERQQYLEKSWLLVKLTSSQDEKIEQYLEKRWLLVKLTSSHDEKRRQFLKKRASMKHTSSQVRRGSSF